MKVKVRALTFRKRFSPQREFNEKWWVVLGHTDEMDCSDLCDMSLADIKKHNDAIYKQDRDSAYHHVIYLIVDENDSLEKDSAVWKSNNNYFAVTRIHFPQAVDHQEQFDALITYFEKLHAENNYTNVCWNTYYTTELSDMVLVSSSTSFQSLSQWALLSTKTNLVGDAYTYFCLPPAFVFGDESPETIDNDVLDFISVRCSVRDNNANEQIKLIRECLGEDITWIPFGISGNEDVLICGHDVPMRNLLNFYKFCYSKTYEITDVFRDVITRIGVNWESVDCLSPDIDVQSSKLSKYSKAVSRKVYNSILQKNFPQLENREWLRPLVELTNALAHMSDSAALDEPVFLILPAIDAFWDNVLKQLSYCNKEQDTFILPHTSIYLRFAELCIHTLEHLMRAEGQLSQRPEVRPLAYDIPVFVLEYVTSFLLKFNSILVTDDTVSPICFLLVPSSKMHIETIELFESKDIVPGLLQITVPFPLLYDPQLLLPALCHELAHYVGEKFRMRKFRYGCFLQAVASVIRNRLFYKIESNAEQFQKFLVEEFLDDSLQEGYLKQNPAAKPDDITELPLLDIFDHINMFLINLCKFESYADFIKEYVNSNYPKAKLHSLPRATIENLIGSIQERVYDLLILFRETYADICMLHFLNISLELYFDIAIGNWSSVNDTSIRQICITLIANGVEPLKIAQAMRSWGKKEGADTTKVEIVCDKIKETISVIYDHMKCPEFYILEYIKECKTALDTAFPYIKNPDDNIMDKMYRNILEDSFDYKTILKTIDESRKNILKQLHDN